MTEHLTEEKIQQYLSRELEAADLLKADDHLSACDDCFKRLSNLLPASDSAFFNFPQILAEEPQHLSYTQLENYVDEHLDETEREIAEVHLNVCADCKTELDGLFAMRNLIEEDLQKHVSTTLEKESIFAFLQNHFAQKNFLKFGFAAAAILIFASLIGVFWFSMRDKSSEVAVSETPSNINSATNRNELINTSPSNIQENVISNAPSDTNSNILENSENKKPEDSAIENLPPELRAEIQRAINSSRLSIPAEISGLNNQSGTLMSGGTQTVPFALSSPVGKIVQTNRPQFRWKALSEADGYIVNVFDENFNKVAESPQISSTSWQINKPLAGNRTYIWQVTAIKDGEEIKSPVRPAPDARFKVLDSKKSNELSSLSRRYKSEHLFLGIMYAKAGLLDEAAREFQREISKNPNSKQARKFLQEVRRRKISN